MSVIKIVVLHGESDIEGKFSAVDELENLSPANQHYYLYSVRTPSPPKPTEADVAAILSAKTKKDKNVYRYLCSTARRQQITHYYGHALAKLCKVQRFVPDVLICLGHGELLYYQPVRGHRVWSSDYGRMKLPEFASPEAVGDGGSTTPQVFPWLHEHHTYSALALGNHKQMRPKYGALVVGEDLSNVANWPIIPRKLWISLSCFAGWEPSLAQAVIGRGCPHFIGARKSLQTHMQDNILRRFFSDWTKRGNTLRSVEEAFEAGADTLRKHYMCLYSAPLPTVARIFQTDVNLPTWHNLRVLYAAPSDAPRPYWATNTRRMSFRHI